MLTILQQHQLEFTNTLIHPTGEYNNFFQKIKSPSKISPQLALDIYRNNTRGARINSLEIIYPVCNKILGEDIFNAIAKEYVIADATGCSDLNHYGRTFNQHLDQLLRTERLEEEYRYLSDLTKLEHLIHSAYYNDNDTEFDFDLFSQKVNKNEPVYLKISTSLGLVKSKYPIYEIWLNNQKQQAVENINAIKDTQYLLIHRKKHKPLISTINKNEYLLIEAIINNFSFQQIIENFEFDSDIILPKLIANKWISGIR
ncbi:MAG: hypothetical protein GQ549_06430 [Gammaproteobacteria bacterium]|nr:hypothetical protein [Gammaproteobacteria bacterium]